LTYPELTYATPPEWVERIAEGPLELLSDHAHNELKAAATAQAWIMKHPGKSEMVRRLATLAAQEVEHFERVIQILYARGGKLQPVEKSPYADALLTRSSPTRSSNFLDRMILAALIEARSCERFVMLAEGLEDRELSALYGDLIEVETTHKALFVDLAREFFPEDEVEPRLTELWQIEGEVIESLPFSFRMHSGVR